MHIHVFESPVMDLTIVVCVRAFCDLWNSGNDYVANSDLLLIRSSMALI